MDEIDRISLCMNIYKTQIKDLIEKTGMERTRLSRTLSKKLRLSSNELIDIANTYQIHKHWIVFGEELPESGQISPMTKLTAEANRNKGKN